jgi:hypothetical protein
VTLFGRSQRAGEGSQQLQAARDIVVINQGITEERAHEIAQLEAERLMSEFAVEARATIDARLSALDDRVFPALSERGAIEAFADPAFVRSYRKAQSGAAASERPADYDTLAALLAKRTETPLDRRITTTIDRAIESVDQLDDESLRGLTVLWAVGAYHPTHGWIEKGLDTYETVYAQLLDGPLPLDFDWIDHLDILDIVRRNDITRLKPFTEMMSVKMLGYVVPGCEESSVPEFVNSEEFPGLTWSEAIIDHELKPGFKRPAVSNESDWRTRMQQQGSTEVFADGVIHAAREAFGFGNVDGDALTELMVRLRTRPALATIEAWWGSIPIAVQPTAVGRTLAEANAYRLVDRERLPPRGTKPGPSEPAPA